MIKRLLPRFYKLVDGEPVECAGLAEWTEAAAENFGLTIARTRIGDCVVSTIFLGIDVSLGRQNPPPLFETMIFGSARDGFQARAATLAGARAIHSSACRYLRELRRKPKRANGGNARMAKLTPRARSELARKAANARWHRRKATKL